MASEAPQSPTSSKTTMAVAVVDRLLSTTSSTIEGMGGTRKPSDQAAQPPNNTTNSFGLSLPLGGHRESSKNQFNLAKARADAAAAAAAAAAGVGGSLSSTYRSRRQSGSSQISYSSKYSSLYPF